MRCALFRGGRRRALVRLEHAPPAARRLVDVAGDGRGGAAVPRVEHGRGGGVRRRCGRTATTSRGWSARTWTRRRATGAACWPASPRPRRCGADRPAPGRRGPAPRHGARCGCPRSARRGWRSVAQRTGVTLNTVVQGAWGLLLARYAGREDVVFGTTVLGAAGGAGGGGGDGGPLHQHPSRAHARASRRAAGRVARRTLQRAQAEAREYEYTPLVQVQAVERGAARHAALREPVRLRELSHRAQRRGRGGRGPARVAGARAVECEHVSAHPGGGPRPKQLRPGPELRREPVRGRHHRAACWTQLDRVLEQVAQGGPTARLSASWRCWTRPSAARVVEEWNRTERPFPRGATVHALFDAQVRARPDAEALAWGDERLTYAELDARANRLAHHLRRARRGAGGARGRAAGARDGAGRRHPGHPQGGRLLRAAGSRLPGGAAAADAGGCRRRACSSAARTARPRWAA